MNEHVDDHFDDALDRAARQLVEHDPPARLHAAVMAEICATSPVIRSSWRWWSLVAAPAAVALVLALMLWDQPREAVHRTLPAPKVTITPPPPRTNAKTAVTAEGAAGSRRERGRRLPTTAPVISELAAGVAPIEVPEISMKSLQVAAIALNEIAIPPIRIGDIADDLHQE